MKISVSQTFMCPFQKRVKVPVGQGRVSWGLTENWFSCALLDFGWIVKDTLRQFFGIASALSTLCAPFTLVWKKVLIGNQKVKFAFRGGRKNFDLFLLMAGWVSNIYLSWIHELSREGVLIPSTISTVKSRAEARLD